ncbi:MAG: tRNA pseudouridine(13) synthase TruD [Nitrososphaerota archaeon]|nr:tRNA pseudouridine(13) synthase TruD [Nitrososphaerota archaeon]
MTLEPPAADISAGMTVYASSGDRLAGRIRASRGDFAVDELFDLGQVESERKEGYVPVYSLRKSGLDTPHAARELGEALKSNVNFAGLKDSHAVTTQYASARSSRACDPLTVTGKGFEAHRVGYLPRPISRSMIAGNSFRIVVRTGQDISRSIDEAYALCLTRSMPNFFGYQRFGLRSMVNHRTGKAILKRDFRGAMELFLGEPRVGEQPEAAEARSAFREGRYADSRKLFSARQDIERRVAGHLAAKPGDFFGAFRRVPILPRRLLVQSYQAYLFNLTLSRALESELQISHAENGDNWSEVAPDGLRVGKVHGVKEPVPEGALPLIQLVGYAFRDYGSRFDRLTLQVLREEGVAPAAFYVKEAEEVSNEGGFRHAPLLLSSPASEKVDGGFALSFNLGRGEYATTLLREVLKPADPLTAGF